MAIAEGADAIGLVAEMPSGPGPIDDATIQSIAQAVPQDLKTFLLTSRTEPAAVIDHVRYCGTNTVQLVDWVGTAAYAPIRRTLPALSIVQVLHVTGEETLRQALEVAPLVDAILLDSGNPGLQVKELGGTGRVHDWRVSRRIVEAVDRPVYLAGGLSPENVVQAIQTARPYGVDLCSGVRHDGRLAADRLAVFTAAVRSASGD